MGPERKVVESTVSLAAYEVEITELLQQAKELVGTIDDRAINFAPPSGGWSVGQCLEHLSDTHGMYAVSLGGVIENAREAGQVDPNSIGRRFGWFERWFIKNLEPPPRRRFKAPKKVHPKAELDADVVRQRYLQALDKTLDLRRQADGLDFHRVRIASPLASWIRFRLGAVFALLTAHDRRHLWQAQQVASSDSYPG